MVLALLNLLGKDRAYPRLPISCPSPTPTPKSHSNEYSTPYSKVLVFHASLNLWVESTGESRFSCATELRCVAFFASISELVMLTLHCVTTYAAQRMQALRRIVNQPLLGKGYNYIYTTQRSLIRIEHWMTYGFPFR